MRLINSPFALSSAVFISRLFSFFSLAEQGPYHHIELAFTAALFFAHLGIAAGSGFFPLAIVCTDHCKFVDDAPERHRPSSPSVTT